MLRRPPELAAGLAGIDPLLADFVLGLVEDLGLEIRCHQRPNPVDELEYRETRLPSEVERLPAQFRPLCKRLRKPRHTLGSVLDVEIVPNVTPVRADDRPLRPEQRANSAGNDSLPLEIASAVHVPASADRDAEAVALGIGLGKHVRARLGGGVRMPSRERIRFDVRRPVMVSVRLVGRCDDDACDKRSLPALLEHGPRAQDVVLECRDWVVVRDADLRLRGEVHDDIGAVLGERAFDCVTVADVTIHAHDGLVGSEDRAARPVDVEPDHTSTGAEQEPREPAAK